jgi:hypothetical protein
MIRHLVEQNYFQHINEPTLEQIRAIASSEERVAECLDLEERQEGNRDPRIGTTADVSGDSHHSITHAH